MLATEERRASSMSFWCRLPSGLPTLGSAMMRGFDCQAHTRSTERGKEITVRQACSCGQTRQLNTRSDLLDSMHKEAQLRPTAWSISHIAALIPPAYFSLSTSGDADCWPRECIHEGDIGVKRVCCMLIENWRGDSLIVLSPPEQPRGLVVLS